MDYRMKDFRADKSTQCRLCDGYPRNKETRSPWYLRLKFFMSFLFGMVTQTKYCRSQMVRFFTNMKVVINIEPCGSHA
ncbi:unnamed protein product [Cylicocyclus nassatus]|uniref:Uncharacterized protein n=1 Tax=Cylicocyclus nassatus TaxID=53992 RepID=A0AA36DJJ9_CYLNA|nr:unnamed protein product [Cylicocyclus nassatus]